MTTKISSWGRMNSPVNRLIKPENILTATELITESSPGLAIGYERSYGDVALNTAGTVWDLTGLNAFISFDAETGVLSCEAGVSLGEIQRQFSPLKWMLSVTPGTQQVSVGGAVANDVHGKNHHVAGTFGCHVLSLQLLRSTGEILTCSRSENAGLFAATIGGLGLTGVILTVTMQLERVVNPYFTTDTVAFQKLSEFFTLTHESDSPYSVAWIDTSTDGGRRGVFHHGDRATPAEAEQFERQHAGVAARVRGTSPQASGIGSLAMPFTPPASLVNRLTVPFLNRGYYRAQVLNTGRKTTDYGSFFYPLDAIGQWNRMYGPKGFFQFQAALPWNTAEEAVAQMLQLVSRSGEGSFLGVLKGLGAMPSPGLLSYPREGVNFTVDFPDRGPSTHTLLKTLEALACEAGGRLYPAKDATMSRDTFRAGYPHTDEFLTHRDPGMVSDFSRRLLDE